MIKRILVPLDSSPYAQSALNFACKIAQQLDAEVTGLVVLDIHGIEKSIGPVPVGGSYYADHLEKIKEVEAKERINAILAEFENKCQREGIRYAKSERQGSPSQNIIEEAIYYDAVMMGTRTYFKFGTDDHPGDSLDKIMDKCITPIYAVPASFSLPKIPVVKINSLIAFDGSQPAARALQRFAQLAMTDVLEITLLNSSHDLKKGEFLLNQAEAFLKGHGFSNIHKDLTDEKIISVIENQYLDRMDLFVVGANSKSDLMDFFLGSLTKSLIKKDQKAILIGQ